MTGKPSKKNQSTAWRSTHALLPHNARPACCYGGLSVWGGYFGTLTYPHLILSYSAYYGHLASHCGGPWCPRIPWWCDKKHLHRYLSHLYTCMKKMVGLPVPNILTTRSPHTQPPPYDFLNLYGARLQAPRTPKIQTYINCHAMLVRHETRLHHCTTAVDSRA
jgi:hypothetical protein